MEEADASPSDEHGSEQMTGWSSSLFGGWARMDPASAVARVRRRTTSPADAPGGAGTSVGSAPMGGRTRAKDLWGDGMINEADRGGAHDY